MPIDLLQAREIGAKFFNLAVATTIGGAKP